MQPFPFHQKWMLIKPFQPQKKLFIIKNGVKCYQRLENACLYKLADLIEDNADYIAEVITLENGKPFIEAKKSEVLGAAKTFRYYAGWCTKIEGETFDVSIPQPNNKQNFAFTKREPVGVVAAITPWNTPFSIIAWKIAPALAVGCTMVLKTFRRNAFKCNYSSRTYCKSRLSFWRI